jgi:hypothetical protein
VHATPSADKFLAGAYPGRNARLGDFLASRSRRIDLQRSVEPVIKHSPGGNIHTNWRSFLLNGDNPVGFNDQFFGFPTALRHCTAAGLGRTAASPAETVVVGSARRVNQGWWNRDVKIHGSFLKKRLGLWVDKS